MTGAVEPPSASLPTRGSDEDLQLGLMLGNQTASDTYR